MKLSPGMHAAIRKALADGGQEEIIEPLDERIFLAGYHFGLERAEKICLDLDELAESGDDMEYPMIVPSPSALLIEETNG